MVWELDRQTGLSWGTRLTSTPAEIPTPSMPDVLGNGIRNRIDFMASHMFSQLKEHDAAQVRTERMFAELLMQIEETVTTFRDSLLRRDAPAGNIYAQIDSDRSVAILQLLWHTISFTMRGNTKPMALKRNGREPQFTGRIVAFLGDYHNVVAEHCSQDVPDLLEDELASLYIPAGLEQPAVMVLRHRAEELYFHPAEATQQFLLKVLEAVCGGGYFHESAD